MTGHVHDTSVNPFIRTSEGKDLGDPFPVYWDGVWHLYTLNADLTAVIHFTSTDLVRWVEHQPAMVGSEIATGSIVRDKGNYYLFYTHEKLQTILQVVSDNPWEFDFSKSRLVVEADGQTYRKGWFRDAYVFYNEQEELWWMVLEARCPEVCAGLFKSKNLLEWTKCEPILKDLSREFASCPQVFKQDKLWYLACQDYPTWYYTAQSLYGPWELGGHYHSIEMTAASRFATDGKRQLTWGWFTDRSREDLPYGGPLGIGREMVFKRDGTLGVRPLPELLVAIRESTNKTDLFACVREESGDWKIDAVRRTLRCDGESGGILLLDLPGNNPNYFFEAEVEFGSPQVGADIVVRTSDKLDRGCRVVLAPDDRKLALCEADHGGARLNETEYAYPRNDRVNVQIFVCDDAMEAFVDGLSSISRRPTSSSDHRMAIKVTRGSATIRNPFLHYFKNQDADPAVGSNENVAGTKRSQHD